MATSKIQSGGQAESQMTIQEATMNIAKTHVQRNQLSSVSKNLKKIFQKATEQEKV